MQTRLVVLQFRHVRKRRVRLLLSRPSPCLPSAGTRHCNPKDLPRGRLVAATACYMGLMVFHLRCVETEEISLSSRRDNMLMPGAGSRHR